MFEQATLTYGPPGKRVWTAFLGLTSQVALVSGAVMASMAWPQMLPTTKIWESLIPPVPPGRAHPEEKLKQEVRRVRPHALLPLESVQPAVIPDHVSHLVEEAPSISRDAEGVVGGGTGLADGVVGSILADFVKATPHVAPPVAPAPVARVAPVAPPIQRIVEGGVVHLGLPLFKETPPYPAMAKLAHVSGDVKLECVVGVDGHIKEVKLVSGSPLLVHAAMDAAWRWVYAPSKLNGVPIEIVTYLTFNFKLN